VDVPLLASGEGTEFVDYFHDGVARRDLNLRSALAVAKDVARDFPTAGNQLAEAALLVALAQLHGEDARLHEFYEEWSGWLDRAEQLLVEIAEAGELEEAGADLRPIHLEVLTRAYLLRNGPERAREALRDAPPTILTSRELARRLVTMTQESLRYQPIEILTRIGEKLAQVRATSAGRNAAELALQDLIQAERDRLAEPYRIGPPQSVEAE
jgi:hypothetical protein